MTTGDKFDHQTWIRGGLVGDSCPAASGPTYTAALCPLRVLLRCP